MSEKRLKSGRRPSQIIVSISMFAIAIVLFVVGVIGYATRGSDFAQGMLIEMRSYAVMRASVEGVIKRIELAAKKDAQDYANANGYTRNERGVYMVEQGVLARAEAEAKYANFEGVDASKITPILTDISALQVEYHRREDAERNAYAEKYEAVYNTAELARADLNGFLSEGYAIAAEKAAAETPEGETVTVKYAYDIGEVLANSLPEAYKAYSALDDQEQKIYMNLLTAMGKEIVADLNGTAAVMSEEDTGIPIDYSFFAPSDELKADQEAIEPYFAQLWTELKAVIPELQDNMQADCKDSILKTIDIYKLDFADEYDQYADAHGENVVEKSDRLRLSIARNADSLFLIGIELLFLSLTVFFYRRLINFLGVPRLILILFFLTLCIVGALYGINVSYMIGNILKRTGMYGVLALAMLPGIQCGIGLNLGMTIGCISGLLSTMIALEFGATGTFSFAFAVILGCVIAVPLGWGYGLLLNRIKGQEMTISTYVGFSFVSLMCVAWMMLPFRNPKITWILGTGLRVTHNLKYSFGGILNKFLQFDLLGANVPTGLLLFFALCCLSMWIFSRSKTGIAMIATGSNPRFAEAAGINVNRMRIIGTVLSTVIASVGIIVYSQSLGYAQLYSSSRQMGFIAASAILIGGATVSRGKVSHVIIGTFLFQAVLALGVQVANAAISGGGLSEITRILISNGIILYALTQSGGGWRD